MTQLLSLLHQIFGHQTKTTELEQFINAHQPSTEKEVEELSRDYLYFYSICRGF